LTSLGGARVSYSLFLDEKAFGRAEECRHAGPCVTVRLVVGVRGRADLLTLLAAIDGAGPGGRSRRLVSSRLIRLAA
jgi:hypothetical protein